MDLNKAYKLVIFDVDGTLVTTKSGATFRKSEDDWQLLPGRASRCQQLRAQDIKLACATNQGGVAFGFLNREKMMSELIELSIELDLTGNQVCFTHPKASIEQYRSDDYNRKPKPGMLFKAMAFHQVMPADTLYVGDREEDAQAAKNAGVDFEWTKDFFGDDESPF